MVMIGGDAPALFGFASQLLERRRRIAQAASELATLVENANWVGRDRDGFVQAWSQEHAPRLLSVCADLDDAAQRVTNHARAQEETSQG